MFIDFINLLFIHNIFFLNNNLKIMSVRNNNTVRRLEKKNNAIEANSAQDCGASSKLRKFSRDYKLYHAKHFLQHCTANRRDEISLRLFSSTHRLMNLQ